MRCCPALTLFAVASADLLTAPPSSLSSSSSSPPIVSQAYSFPFLPISSDTFQQQHEPPPIWPSFPSLSSFIPSHPTWSTQFLDSARCGAEHFSDTVPFLTVIKKKKSFNSMTPPLDQYFFLSICRSVVGPAGFWGPIFLSHATITSFSMALFMGIPQLPLNAARMLHSFFLRLISVFPQLLPPFRFVFLFYPLFRFFLPPLSCLQLCGVVSQLCEQRGAAKGSGRASSGLDSGVRTWYLVFFVFFLPNFLACSSVSLPFSSFCCPLALLWWATYLFVAIRQSIVRECNFHVGVR